MSLIERIDAARARCNILEHPFYVRWEAGELSRAELARYAAEYRHAAVALADAAETAAPLAGTDHADEERAHVDLWDDFAAALDSAPCEPQPRTAACADAWRAGVDALEATAILYAIEAGQPDVSRTKLDGLVRHYGFEAGSRGTEYFSLHAERDVEHAAEARDILAGHASPADEDRLVAVAERALAANWTLLDGVSA
jgi:pyrroloquinoline-quinone synthase